MRNAEKEIISVLVKSVFDKGLISEMTYRNALNRLRTFDGPPSNLYSELQQNHQKKCNPCEGGSANGYTKSQG